MRTLLIASLLFILISCKKNPTITSSSENTSKEFITFYSNGIKHNFTSLYCQGLSTDSVFYIQFERQGNQIDSGDFYTRYFSQLDTPNESIDFQLENVPLKNIIPGIQIGYNSQRTTEILIEYWELHPNPYVLAPAQGDFYSYSWIDPSIRVVFTYKNDTCIKGTFSCNMTEYLYDSPKSWTQTMKIDSGNFCFYFKQKL